MGQMIELTAADGFKLSAYRAEPSGKPRGGLVVVQEIFGVNSHIKSVCDGFAADGYLAIAPALFDRFERVSTSATRRTTSRRAGSTRRSRRPTRH